MQLVGFIEKDNKIAAVRVKDDQGHISDLYLTGTVGISNLDCMQTEYLRGICFHDKSRGIKYNLVTLEEIKEGRFIERYSKDSPVFITKVLKPRNYVESDTAYFPRERELNMYDWLYNAPDKVLYVQGARQTGKTYLINHFIAEAFGTEGVFKVNLTDENTQKALLEFRNTPMGPGTFGQKGYNTYIEGFMKYLDSSFSMDTAKVLYMDEIQADSGLYNGIREFARERKCRLIVSGSYLNILTDQRSNGDKKYIYPTGGDYPIELLSLSFTEFLRANGIINAQVLLKDSSVYTKEEKELFMKVQALYQVYCEIGGYPEVVKAYIEEGISDSNQVMEDIFHAYMTEAQHYVGIWYPMADLYETLVSVASVLLDANKTYKKQDVMARALSDFKIKHPGVNERTVAASVRWLMDSGFLKPVSSYIDDSFTAFGSANGKMYFTDLGLANYFIQQCGAFRPDIRDGFLAENFVFMQLYHGLSKNGRYHNIWIKTAVFRKKVNVELDFICKTDMKSSDLVLVEVKHGNNRSNSFDLYKHHKAFTRAVKFINRATDLESESVPIFLARYFVLTL